MGWQGVGTYALGRELAREEVGVKVGAAVMGAAMHEVTAPYSPAAGNDLRDLVAGDGCGSKQKLKKEWSDASGALHGSRCGP